MSIIMLGRSPFSMESIVAMAWQQMSIPVWGESILHQPHHHSISKRQFSYSRPARINRWTGRPHEHKREIARRTTPPGSGIRRVLYEQARDRVFQD